MIAPFNVFGVVGRCVKNTPIIVVKTAVKETHAVKESTNGCF